MQTHSVGFAVQRYDKVLIYANKNALLTKQDDFSIFCRQEGIRADEERVQITDVGMVRHTDPPYIHLTSTCVFNVQGTTMQ